MKEFIKREYKRTTLVLRRIVSNGCLSLEYPKHRCICLWCFMVAFTRARKQGTRSYAPVDVIDFWPVPVVDCLMRRSGTVTGVVEEGAMHLWLLVE